MSRKIKPTEPDSVYDTMKHFKLDDHPKIGTGFQIPEGYFDTLPDAVFSRLEQNGTKVVALRPARTLWYAAAAVLALALAVPFANRFYGNAQADDTALIENYLHTQSGMSQYDIAELLTEEDLSRLDSDIPADDQAIEDLLSGNSNLENYILN